MSEFDAPVKYGVICLCAYIVFITSLPERFSRAKYAVGGVVSLLPALFMTLFRDLLIPFHIISMVAVFILAVVTFFKLRPGKVMTLTLVSFGFSYAAFFISTMLVIFSVAIYCDLVLGDYRKADIFFSSVLIHVVTVLVMQVIQIVLLWLVLRSRRVRSGLVNIVKLGASDVGIYISVMIMLFITLFGVMYKHKVSDITSTVILIDMVGCIVLILFWVRYQIKASYIHNVMSDEVELLKKSLVQKDELISRLQEDNDRLAGIIHKDNKLIPAMVASVRQYTSDISKSGDFDSAVKAVGIAEQLERIYGERNEALSNYELNRGELPSTGVVSVDAVLFYMAQKANKNGIKFRLDTSEDVKDILDGVVDKHEFNTILADLVENAIIAAKDSDGKAVLVSISCNEGNILLSVSDSGAELNEAVLRDMGIRKITTHADNGGSGTGLMNLFAVLKKYRASFLIKHHEAHSDYTKSLIVTFDGMGRISKGEKNIAE